MNLDASNKLIDEYITKVRSCIPASKDKYDDLKEIKFKIIQLIRSIYPNSAEVIKEFIDSMKAAHKYELNGFYTKQAKVMESYLLALKDYIYLNTNSKNEGKRLDSLKNEIEEKRIESLRRKKVTETKFYGAAIEIIDRLRAELKGRSRIEADLITIKDDIKDIKRLLENFSNLK